jgi:uncharacterized metal-binding protein YceD (DUF177 family)
MAMSDPAPEFSRPVRLQRLGTKPFRQRIEATAEERQKLSQRFDLMALCRLVAEVELRRQDAEIVVLEAQFEAEFERCCAATLEPVRGTVADRFSLVYGPAPEQQQEVILSAEEPAFEPLQGDIIDVGEAVAQELSLAIPAFLRDPDAAIDDVLPAETLEGAFATLARLRKESEC